MSDNPLSASLVPPGSHDQSTLISNLRAELEQAKADLARLQIESESDLNASNVRLIELESKLGQEDQLRAKLTQSLEELTSLKTSLQTRTGDHEQFSKQIEGLENEKRELLEVVRDKETEYAELEAELKSKNDQLTSSKSAIRELESTLLTVRESERTALLQVQALKSDAGLASSDRDFYVKELERTREEWQTFRTQNNQLTSRLRNDFDQLTHTYQNTTTNLESLRLQHADLQKSHSDALDRIKLLTHQSIEAEAAFQKEIEAQKRVTELMDKRDKARSERMEQLEKEWNSRRAELDEREKAINEALEKERANTAELQQKLTDTNNALSRVCAVDLGDPVSNDEHDTSLESFLHRTPGTPLSRIANGVGLTNGLSPAAAMASKLQKSGKSLTDVYTEKMMIEEQLKKSKLENIRLSETLSQILGEIQDRAPLLHQQRVEHERIERECDEITTQLTRAIEDKEEAERKYQSCLLDLTGLQRDQEISNRQLDDLSLQIRTLVKAITDSDLASQGKMIGGDEEDLFKDAGARRVKDVEEEEEDILLDNDLITFKTIAELQQKNLRLLFLARKLTSKLQVLEETKAERSDDADEDETRQAIDEAHELILQLKNDLQSAQHKTEALSRERDMLRRMLNQAQQQPMLDSGDGDISGPEASQLDSSHQKLEELNAQFEAYRSEIGADAKKINEDLNRARADLSRTQVLLAKANAQIDYLNERHRTFDQTNAMHAQEMQTLTQSNARLQEHIARSEVLLHQANENVTELRSKCHVLQHQVETLTTEREVWKGVEGRLTAENTSLARERNNISDILRNMQSMQAEIERNSTDSRRRLEAQVVKLETQVRDLKDRLKVEADGVRQANLQREFVTNDYQQKLDKLNSEHVKARELLSSATTAKEHLDGQVIDLQKQLAIKEERLAVYESHRKAPGSVATNVGSDNASLTAEQRLQIEVAELKMELAAATEESAKAKEHIAQFKAIAQSSEAALASLTATHDEYKSHQEAELTLKQNTLSSLEEHLKKVTEDLSSATTQNSELHRQLESQRVDFEKEKATLLNKLSELEEIETRVKTREGELRAEINQQVTTAQDNHDRYRAEVQNHAESLNELKYLKEELAKARETITVAQSAAETATTKLTSSEASWNDQKSMLQNEITNIQNRCDDLMKQNNLLHEHLETVSAQAAKISNQTVDTAAGGTAEGTEGVTQPNTNENTVESIEQLRGVIRYLRNNHDIAQQQIELSKLESTRLQQQLQHASKALDQTRLELNNERERSRQGYVSSAEHAQLLDQINTLNMVRESNVTLRDEANRSERKAKQLEERLTQLNSTLEPLKKELIELRLSVEQYQQEIVILTEDNERWKTRNQQILEKYDRIDPAEVQGLRDEIAQLKQDLSQSRDEVAQTLHFKEKFYTIQAQARSVRQKSIDDRAAWEVKLNTVNEELEILKETVRTMEADAKTSQTQANTASEQALTESQRQLNELKQAKSEVEVKLMEAVAHQAQAAELQATLEGLRVELDQTKAVALKKETINSKLMIDNKALFASNKQLTAEMTSLKAEAAQQSSAPQPPQPPPEEVIEAEVTKRLNEKLAAMPSDQLKTEGTDVATEQMVQYRLREAGEKAIAERQAAVTKAIEETTARLTAEFNKTQAEAIERVRIELTSTQATVANAAEEQIAAQVASRVAEIKSELEAVAVAKEKELTEKHEAQLKEAAAAAAASIPPTVALPEGPEAITDEKMQEAIKVAVDEALKTREAELQEAHKLALESAVETTRSKVTAEMNSKVNVTQMQLKRAQATIADLKKKTQQPSAPSTPGPTGTPLVATSPAFVPPNQATTSSPTTTPATQNPPHSSSSATNTTTAVAEPIPKPFATTPLPSSLPNIPPMAFRSTRGGGPVTFGRASVRGAGRGAGGRAAGRGGAATTGGIGQLPAEGRMSDKQPATPAGLPNAGSMVAIRGAASKRGGAAAGSVAGSGTSLLGAAVKAATENANNTSNNIVNQANSGVGGSTTSLLGASIGKRAREDEMVTNGNNNIAGNSVMSDIKRIKNGSVSVGGNEESNGASGQSDLVNRLGSKRAS